jgi:hypothetical protein
MDEMLFPEPALAVLRQARWETNALRSYEIMSGGFQWSDERLGEAARICMEHRSWAFRYVLGYRASLTRGAPREGLRAPWDQLLRECPDWPGFRAERVSPELAAELDREWRRVCVGFRRLERRARHHADNPQADGPITPNS